jgi:FeS assembly SUF system regulator
MLRISKLADYAIVVMQQLALQPELLQSATGLAEHTRVGVPTVSKLLKLLQEAGLVASVRGTSGGYKLARIAGQVTIAEVIAAIEGPVALTECSGEHSVCTQQKTCGTKGNWQLINAVVMNALNGITLADMAGSLAMHPLMVGNK